MAEFDFDIDIASSERPFLQSLLRLAQRLSNLRGLKLRYRWSSESTYRCTVDGSLPSMQAFLDPLVYGLLSYVEGATKYGTANYRKTMARRLSKAYAEGLDEMSEFVNECSVMFKCTPNSLSFDVGTASQLRGHLDGFTNFLSLYQQGKIKPYQIAEEAHTALELLMGQVLGQDAKNKSFAQMVDLVVQKQYLKPDLEVPIIRLKNHRRGSKHKGQEISYQDIDELLPAILEASHQLVRIINRSIIPSFTYT